MSLLKSLPLLALALCPTPALADVLVHSVSTNALEAPFSQPLELPRFDPTLGDLISVQIRFSMVHEVNLSAENLAPVPQILTVDAAVFSGLMDSEGRLLHTEAPFATDVIVLQAFDGMLDGAGPSGVRDQLFRYTASDVIDVPSSDHGAFLGTGSALTFLAEDYSSVSSDVGNVVSDLEVNVGLRVQIIYRYSQPASPGPVSLQSAHDGPLGTLREPDAPLLA